jgi:hypothetical protein
VRHHRVVAALLLASSVLTPALSVSPVLAEPGTRQVTSSGTAQLASRADGLEGGVSDPEFAQGPDDAREGAEGHEIQLRQGAGPSTGLAAAGPQVVSAQVLAKTAARVRTSFNGLNFRQQRLANNANQFSVEPPDQGMCVGNGMVLESVNDVIRLFDTNGAPLTGVVDLNTFYGYPAQIVRATQTTPAVQGPFVTDPSCWFDAPTQRWFHTVLTLEVVATGPKIGNFTGLNHLDLAVSNSADPRDGFVIYRLPVQDDGTQGTPNHLCPPGTPGHSERSNPNACIGDFPHLGADKYGLYVTTNEYCLFCAGIGFHAAQIYAFDKRALARHDTTVTVSQIDTLGLQAGKPGFTLWPATTPGDADFELTNGGAEYFTSSNAAEEVSGVPNSVGTNKSDQVVVWALTNTSSLKTSGVPGLHLLNTTVQVDQYAVPAPSTQKAGDFPLGQCINDTTTPTIFGGTGCWTAIFNPPGPAHNEVEGLLDSSDSRVLSTTFVKGFLWGTLDTSVSVGGKTQAGVLWYIIQPKLGTGLVAGLVRQGHIAVANNNAIYGTVAATPTGRALVGFTLVGDDHYPSAAYVSLNGPAGPADINVIAEGLGPQDGFSEYKAFASDGVHPRPRWGDYGASVATDNNTIWVAAEYIAQTCTLAQYMSAPFGSCGGTRATLGNWGTRLTAIDVSP